MNMTTPVKLMLIGFLMSGCADSGDPEQQSSEALGGEAELSQAKSSETADQQTASLEEGGSSESSSSDEQSATDATQSAAQDSSDQSSASDKPQPKPIQGLCGADQTTHFSCQIGAKLASVCSTGTDELSYRFGTLAKTELNIVSPVHYSRTSYSGGGEGRLRFSRGEYDYVVHSGIYAGDWQPDGTRGKVERAGVYVIQGGKQIADLACDPYPELDLNSETLPEHKVEEFVYYD
jgi:hypothetical protein